MRYETFGGSVVPNDVFITKVFTKAKSTWFGIRDANYIHAIAPAEASCIPVVWIRARTMRTIKGAM